MKSLIAFWKKDIINKLIVLVALALVAGALGLLAVVLILPQGGSLGQAFAEILPARSTPTFDVYSYLTPRTATVSPYTSTPSPTPPMIVTIPTLPPTEEIASPTLDAAADASAATLAAAILPPTSAPAGSTPTPAALTTPTSAAGPTGAACIPANTRKTGRVVEILDGNTLRVLIEGPTYVVRYIGVGAPEQPAFAEAARLKNQELAYGKEVTLIEGLMQKDERGRLLFYVMAGDTFINLEIIKQGLGLALDAPPNNDCLTAFQAAQQQALAASLGLWSVPTTTPAP